MLEIRLVQESAIGGQIYQDHDLVTLVRTDESQMPRHAMS